MGLGTLFAIIGGLLILGGGFGFLVWLFTRPKKMVWEARVWQLSDSEKQIEWETDDGKPVEFKLQDLRPYTKDILEQIEPEPGATVYRLRKLNTSCPKPGSGCVDKWGDMPEVNVLHHKGSCTLLSRSYDKHSGQMIWNPIPYETSTMVQHNIISKKSKLQKEKDILQSISPWIVGGIIMLGLVACSYILTQGWIQMSNKQAEMQKYSDDKGVEIATIFREALMEYSNIEGYKLNESRLPSGSGVPGII